MCHGVNSEAGGGVGVVCEDEGKKSQTGWNLERSTC